MRLTRVDDPRDNLEKATRDELWKYAKAKGVKEIDDLMFNGGYAAERMRKVLRQKGLTDINIPYHQLGLPRGTAIEQPSGNPAMKYEDLINEQTPVDVTEEKARIHSEKKVVDQIAVRTMNMWELRKACKAKGIKMERTDNLQKLRDKLSGHQAAP